MALNVNTLENTTADTKQISDFELSITKQKMDGHTPLHWLASKTSPLDLSLLAKFVSKKAVNMQDNNGNAPLHLAVQTHVTKCETFLKAAP